MEKYFFSFAYLLSAVCLQFGQNPVNIVYNDLNSNQTADRLAKLKNISKY